MGLKESMFKDTTVVELNRGPSMWGGHFGYYARTVFHFHKSLAPYLSGALECFDDRILELCESQEGVAGVIPLSFCHHFKLLGTGEL